jgi:flagellar FliJ protein
MKKFRFTLQAALNVKKTLEKQAMGELSETNARIREFERAQAENFALQEEQNTQYRADLEEGINPTGMMFWRWAQLAVRDKIEYQSKVLEQAEGERARIEKKLIALIRERKILEKLRERQMEAYREEERREAAAELADFMGHNVYGKQEG